MTEATIVERVYGAKGDSVAADRLIRDYLPFITSETCKAVGRPVVLGLDDELSVAMLAFHEAVESYQRLRGAFLGYAALLIRRKLIDYYRRERRHAGQLPIEEALPEPTDALQDMSLRDATRQEIAELQAELGRFGLSLTDVADNCPKQARTLASCQRALAYARENAELIAELKRTKKLPLAALVSLSGVERKTLERHRKYLMALMLIYSNGYEIIRGHLKQVGKGGRKG